MATYRVLPRDDGQDFQGSWMIHKNGQMVSNHTTKAAAVNAARRKGSKGDTLVKHRQDGTIQSKSKIRGSKDSDGERAVSTPSYGVSVFETAISDAFK